MIFAKIDYINLLPFYVFVKKNIKSTQIKDIINYKKSYPAYINKQFKNRKIDAAFISSISSHKCKCSKIGIVANGEVLSVLSIDNGFYKKDTESATSNILAKILKLNGKILIGDKALSYYYDNSNNNFIDLSKAWKNKYNMPFVFARFCFVKHDKYFNKLAEKFIQTKVKIPQYILNKYIKKHNLSRNQIIKYLDKITYKISVKEEMSLKLFYKLSKKIKID